MPKRDSTPEPTQNETIWQALAEHLAGGPINLDEAKDHIYINAAGKMHIDMAKITGHNKTEHTEDRGEGDAVQAHDTAHTDDTSPSPSSDQPATPPPPPASAQSTGGGNTVSILDALKARGQREQTGPPQPKRPEDMTEDEVDEHLASLMRGTVNGS